MNIVHWLSKFPLSYFFGSFVLVLRENFTFEFVIYIDTVERVSSLPKYYVYIIGSPKIGLESFILMIEHILVSILFDLTRATLLSLRNTLTLL